MRIWSKLIQILSTQQPNRILIHKPPRIRLIIPEEVVVQPRFKVAILVLQAEGLIRILVNPLILFQMTPAGIVAEPQELAVLIGHISWDADLVTVEVVRLLSVFSVFVDVVLIGETAYVPHISYVRTEGFVRATDYYNLLTEYFMLEVEIPSSNYYSQLIL